MSEWDVNSDRDSEDSENREENSARPGKPKCEEVGKQQAKI